MNIIEARQSDRRFTGSAVIGRGDKYWYVNNEGLVLDDRGHNVPMHIAFLDATDYELYTPEIRPKEAGELWEFIGDDGMKSDLFILQDEDGNLSFIDECGNKDEIPQEMSHNYYDISNGTYFRVKPPVEDCERVEIEDVCPLCEHEWSRHDPEDGMCDAGPYCKCGRDLDWMQQRISEKSKENL